MLVSQRSLYYPLRKLYLVNQYLPFSPRNPALDYKHTGSVLTTLFYPKVKHRLHFASYVRPKCALKPIPRLQSLKFDFPWRVFEPIRPSLSWIIPSEKSRHSHPSPPTTTFRPFDNCHHEIFKVFSRILLRHSQIPPVSRSLSGYMIWHTDSCCLGLSLVCYCHPFSLVIHHTLQLSPSSISGMVAYHRRPCIMWPGALTESLSSQTRTEKNTLFVWFYYRNANILTILW